MNTGKQVNMMIGLMFVFLVGTLLYFVWDDARAEDAEERQIIENAERGGGLFALNCRSCHGMNGLGPLDNANLPGLPLNVETNRPVDPETNEPDLGELMNRQNRVLNTIRCGRVGTLMPQWAEDQGGPLNDFQIEQLVALVTGAIPGMDAPDNFNAISERGWEVAVEEADHADILEGKRLARAVGPEDTLFVLTNAQELIVDSLLRIDGEVVKIVDVPSNSTLEGDIGADGTVLPVNGAGDLFESRDVVRIGTERMRVVAALGDTLRVERAVEGTKAQGHGVKDTVFEVSDEIIVERGAFVTQAAQHEEGAQLFIGPLEPPTGPLTGEDGTPPCGQLGAIAPVAAASPTPAP